MNVKLIRNAMVITVIILFISVMGKTSAHNGHSVQTNYHFAPITQMLLVR